MILRRTTLVAGSVGPALATPSELVSRPSYRRWVSPYLSYTHDCSGPRVSHGWLGNCPCAGSSSKSRTRKTSCRPEYHPTHAPLLSAAPTARGCERQNVRSAVAVRYPSPRRHFPTTVDRAGVLPVAEKPCPRGQSYCIMNPVRSRTASFTCLACHTSCLITAARASVGVSRFPPNSSRFRNTDGRCIPWTQLRAAHTQLGTALPCEPRINDTRCRQGPPRQAGAPTAPATAHGTVYAPLVLALGARRQHGRHESGTTWPERTCQWPPTEFYSLPRAPRATSGYHTAPGRANPRSVRT